MKKTAFLSVTLFALIGCSTGQEKLEMYVDNPKYLIKDPEFESYKGQLDDLESKYLRKEITYVEYLEQKQQFDNTYDKGVQERNDIISPRE
jgi:hypothetical protein